MGTVIDSSLWVDYFRAKTPVSIKRQVIPFIDRDDATLCEPVRFEILRAALESERSIVEDTFATLPILPTPTDIWGQAIILGQKGVDAGVKPRPMDLLIGAICLHHGVTLVTFDSHFAALAKVCPLKIR